MKRFILVSIIVTTLCGCAVWFRTGPCETRPNPTVRQVPQDPFNPERTY